MAIVFGAAFLAGAVAAFGINRALDVHLAQARPQVECEPIFVALRSLPQGSPITVWDVALRDWPKAMLPTSALRADDSFAGMLLRYPLREGQPLVAAQLVAAGDSGAPGRMVGAPAWPERPAPPAEQWTPARPATAAAAPIAVELPAPAQVTSEPAPVEPAPSDLVTHEPAAVDTATSAPDATPAPESGTPPLAPLAAEEAGSTAIAAVEPGVPAGSASVPTDQASDLDERVADLPPVDAAVATVTDVVADLPPVQPSGSPTPAEPPAAVATVAGAAPLPLAPPVPTSPATDIEMPLASITATRPRAAPQESSVLAESDTAAPSAAPAAAAPLRYLVVPERIALQADASFVSPQQSGRGRSDQPPGREASTQPRPQPRGPATPARTGGPTPQNGQRRQTASPPRPGGQGRAEAAPKTTGGWLPKLGFGGFGSGATRPQPAGPAAVR